MNLIILQPFLSEKGGVERAVLELAKAFNPKIYSVVYNPNTTFEEFKEFEIEILPKNILENPFFFLKDDMRHYSAVSAGIRCYFSKIKEDYDVINAHTTPSEWIRNKNPRVVWFCHSPNREAYDLYEFRMRRLSFHKKMINYGLISAFRLIEHSVVPKIERIVTNSHVTSERIKKYLNRSDVEIISPGVNPKEFRNESYQKYFLYPSRITPAKRLEYAVNAFKIFCQVKKGWRLIIAGFLSQKDKQYFNELLNLAKNYPIEFKIDLSDKDLQKLYANSYAVLFSAINEDWGLIPLEAMASEKPCISVAEGGPTYSIIDKKTGFLINSEQEMAEKMIFLANNPDINEQMGKFGRKHVVKNYTWKVFLNKMEKVFKKVANQ